MRKLLLITLTILSYQIFSQNFQWAKGIGGATSDLCKSMKTDSQGNIYVTGDFQGTVDFDPGPATHYLTSAGIYDIFVLKLDPAGNFVWAKNMGGIYTDQGLSIAIDSFGNVYSTGTLQGSGDFDPGPATYTLSGNAQYAYSAYISKLDANGNFVWAKNFALGITKGESITVDALGNVYSVGGIYSTSDFDPGPGTYTLSGSSGNLYISKLNSSGNFVWAKATAADNLNQTFSLTLDLFNALYIHGSYNGTVDFDPGTGIDSYTSVGVQDGFISKFDTAGNYKWTKTLKSSNTCYGAAITTDANGNLYSTGYYYPDADFDPGAGTYSLTATGFGELYVLKLDSTGSFLWAKTTQGGFSSFNTSNVFAYSLALDSQNSVYVTGPFSGQVDFNTGAGADSLDSWSGNSAYILKLTTNGNFQWAQTLGSHNTMGIAIDYNDNMIVAGEFMSSGDFDPTLGNYTLTSNGGDDVFISKTGSSIINVKELSNNSLVHIYPNPNNGGFNIVSKEKMNLSLINNLGQIVETIELNETNGYQQNIHVNTSGIYYINGVTKQSSIKQKIIVTK